VNKKPPTKRAKTPTREERNLYFSKLPKRKYRNGGREPFKKKKKKKGVGGWARLP
jgi:hypothetical protein